MSLFFKFKNKLQKTSNFLSTNIEWYPLNKVNFKDSYSSSEIIPLTILLTVFELQLNSLANPVKSNEFLTKYFRNQLKPYQINRKSFESFEFFIAL